MKIAHFVGVLGKGGIEKSVSDIIKFSDNSSFSFYVIVNYLNSSIYDKLFIEKHVQVKSLFPSYRVNNIFTRAMSLRKILKNENFDVLHIHGSYITIAFYCLVAKLMKVPKRILHSHSSGYNSSDGLIKKAISIFLRPLARWCSTILAGDSASAIEWMYGKRASKNAVVLPLGIDVMAFSFSKEVRSDLRMKYNFQNTTTVIGNVGRLSYAKNQIFLVDLMDYIVNVLNLSNYILFIVGDGEKKKEIEYHVKELNLEDFVIIHPFTTEISQMYSMFDVFVMPSISEGFGLVLLEAQAAGLPIIASSTIPHETKVLKNYVQIPLEYGKDLWFSTICDFISVEREEDAYMLIKNSGYDIKDTIQKITNVYLK